MTLKTFNMREGEVCVVVLEHQGQQVKNDAGLKTELCLMYSPEVGQ